MTVSVPIDPPGGGQVDIDALGEGAPEGIQVGALCWRPHRGKVQVLLVSSRDTGRWVIPKGWKEAGLSPAESAAAEAWEEAGVRGTINPVAIGTYRYDKRRKASLQHCAVAVFALQVATLAKKFAERDQRRRKWVEAGKAAKLVDEHELRDLLTRIGQEPEFVTVPGIAPA